MPSTSLPVFNKLRAEVLWHFSRELSERADDIWVKSESIHNCQHVKGDPNEYGRSHVLTVEYNTWRLLFDPDNRADLVGENKRRAEDNPYEVYLLSAAACCHDFDKAETLPSGVKHGQQSAEMVGGLRDCLGLDDNRVEEISDIIAIHGLPAQEYKEQLQEKNTSQPCTYGRFDSMRLAALLKAADILHIDRSRITDPTGILGSRVKLKRDIEQKVILRSHIRGWVIVGHTIHVEASVENSPYKKSQVQDCFDWVRNNEWIAVKAYLEDNGFPHTLEIQFAQARSAKPSRHTGANRRTSKHAFIPVAAERNLPYECARKLLSSALQAGTPHQPPMCRNTYVTHAAGVAAARLFVLAVQEQVQSSKANVDTAIDEFVLETECILSKLSEHFTRLSRAYTSFETLLREDSLLGDPENPCQATIRALPAGQAFFDCLSDFATAFESGLTNMRTCLCPTISGIAESDMAETDQKQILGSEHQLQERNPDIKAWFMKIKGLFHDAKPQLEEALRSLKHVLDLLQDDWDRDHRRVHRLEKGDHRVPAPFRARA